MNKRESSKAFGGGKPPSQRPSKVCPVCGLPFSWRKKWERDWDNVRGVLLGTLSPGSQKRMNPVVFRPTTENDQPALRQLLQTVWQGEEGGAAYHGWGRRPGMVACVGESIVGYGQLWHSPLHPTYAYAGVHVHPDWRGQGLGSRLWDEVTRDTRQPLKAKTYASQTAAVRFLQAHGLSLSVETYEPTLSLSDLPNLSGTVQEAKNLGFTLLAMPNLTPAQAAQLLPLHQQVYAQAHLHDPARPEMMDEEDFLGDDLCPAWLYVALENDELAGVSSVRLTGDPTQGELAWFGTAPAFASTGQTLTQTLSLALTALALQAASRDGVWTVNAELDSADPNALYLLRHLPWRAGKVWLTLTS